MLAATGGDKWAADQLGLPRWRVRRIRRMFGGKPLRKRLTAERHALIIELISQGASVHGIARVLGITPSAARESVAWAGYEYRWAKMSEGRPPAGELEVRLAMMADEGASRGLMARETGLNITRIRRILNALGYRAAWVPVRSELVSLNAHQAPRLGVQQGDSPS